MTRRSVNRQLGAAALTLATLLVLAGCGEATGSSGPTAADDPAPTSGAAGGGVSGSTGSADAADSSGDSPVSSDLDPSLAQWPAVGCDSRSVVSVDYGRMPTGWDTPEEAVEHSPAGDLPDGVLTLAPAGSAKGPAQVWVVDPDTNEIQAEVSVFRGPDGWFVDGVMTCS